MNLAFIWGNSLLPGEISGSLSNWLENILSFIFNNKPDSPGGGGLLRKLAHFTEFTCLGMCLCWLFGMLHTKQPEHLVFPFVAGAAAACIDETIQLFVPLRGPSVKDVGIDILGVILGIVLISLIQQIKSKKLKYLEENKL